MIHPCGTCVLLGAPAELRELMFALQQLGIEALAAENPDAAHRMLETMPVVSLLAIDGRVARPAATHLLRLARADHPGLPVLWVAPRELVTPLHSMQIPDRLVYPPLDRDELRKDIRALIGRQMYPDALCAALSQQIGEVLSATFAVRITRREEGIRSNSAVLGDVNAIVPFCGRTVGGHILVSGDEAMFFRACEHALGTGAFSPLQLHDLAGELGNVILGRIKALFMQQSLSFEIGIPILLRGAEVRSQYRARRPALALIYGVGRRRLHVVVGFDTFDIESNHGLASVVPQPVATGVVSFL